MKQDRYGRRDMYVQGTFSSHTPEEYNRRLGKIFDLENKIRNLDNQIEQIKNAKKTINYLLKELRTELDKETYMSEPVIR